MAPRCTRGVNLHVRRLSAYTLIALVVSSCSTAEPPAPNGSDVEEPQEVLVTGDSGDAPASCRPSAVGELMVRFLHAVNTASADPSAFFASSFQWYSMTEGNPRKNGRHFVAFDLPKLSKYFEDRSAQNESMKLLELSVQYEPGRDLGHIQYVIERRADDIQNVGPVATGKGAVACAEGKIELLSMAMAKDIGAGVGPLCPESEEPPPDAARVCMHT